jgi:hypothetical protein
MKTMSLNVVMIAVNAVLMVTSHDVFRWFYLFLIVVNVLVLGMGIEVWQMRRARLKHWREIERQFEAARATLYPPQIEATFIEDDERGKP